MVLQSDEAGRLLGDMPEDLRMASWHLVAASGRVWSAGAAFAPLLRQLPGGGTLARLAERMPRAVQWLYGLVAGRRSVFGRLVTDGAKRRADALIARRTASV